MPFDKSSALDVSSLLLYKRQRFNSIKSHQKYEPRHEKPVFVVSDQVGHKPGCAQI